MSMPSHFDAVYTDEHEMFFGKHKGLKLKDVPASYLLWLLEGSLPRIPNLEEPRRRKLLDYITNNQRLLNLEVEELE